MKIDIRQLEEQGQVKVSEVIDYSIRDSKDVLIQKIKNVDIEAVAVNMGKKEYHITLDYVANVTYLDARSLRPLNLTFDFHDDVIFSSDFQKAEEFELEYFEGEEIFLDDLIFDLTCVSLPINYSEESEDTVIKEADSQYENKPFANIFNND